MNPTTFFTTIPKSWKIKDAQMIIHALIADGVLSMNMRVIKTPTHNQLFIQCDEDNATIKFILNAIDQSHTRHVRFDYDHGGKYKGYLLIKKYQQRKVPKEIQENESIAQRIALLEEMCEKNAIMIEELQKYINESLKVRIDRYVAQVETISKDAEYDGDSSSDDEDIDDYDGDSSSDYVPSDSDDDDDE